ncbi:MAG: hypothetical protein BZ151_04365 [Desulfobacca sp. 4484_104]|nr:MAG: hypothetical protein BZ151_04365 [Desulfobacca sp. 4484_104]RLA89454.1 MAG: hypothetical protein DRG58_05035 [Deltaproteobacteria bacterium]
MATVKKTKREGKRELYCAEAQSLYLAGKTIEEIGAKLPVAQRTLKTWQKQGQWEEKRQAAHRSPRLLGEALKGVLRQKTERLLAKGDLRAAEVEELTKLMTLIDRLGNQAWDLKAAALEVMSQFVEFLRQQVRDPKELRCFSRRIQEFFQELEQQK